MTTYRNPIFNEVVVQIRKRIGTDSPNRFSFQQVGIEPSHLVWNRVSDQVDNNTPINGGEIARQIRKDNVYL